MWNPRRRAGAVPLPARPLALLLLLGACHRAPGPAAAPSAEEVNVGYGTQRRENLTSSVASLGEEELRHVQASSMERVLRGRIPGLQVIRVRGDLSLRIRGMGGTAGEAREPHVVIDGVPSTVRDLFGIAPETVHRVDVIKDAGAAVYGVRGANGVILVTTKGRL